MKRNVSIAVTRTTEQRILFLRGERVLLDTDLAALYGVTTKAFNQAVKRNLVRFPPDFMFQLTDEEIAAMRSQIVTASRRNVRFRPFAFTEHGVAMLSSVLRSERAAQVNIEIVRVFVRLRRMLIAHTDLAAKIDKLERKHDRKFAVVFDSIRRLMASSATTGPRIGFVTRGGAGIGARQRQVTAPS